MFHSDVLLWNVFLIYSRNYPFFKNESEIQFAILINIFLGMSTITYFYETLEFQLN